MHTHTNHPILITPTGQSFRTDSVVAAHWTKSGQGLRIATEVGEVITDEWPSREEAQGFLWELGHAMRGITDNGPKDGSGPPVWATAENASIAASAVMQAGGTREHAARVFASTLLGEWGPAPAIDAGAMLKAWDEALGTGGPVHIIAGMPDSDHSRTDDPLTEKSPFLRLAWVTTYMAVDPDRLVFHTVEDLITNPPITDGCAITMGERQDNAAFLRILVPRKVYSWCGLNGVLFGDWVGHGGPAIRQEHRPCTARWDGGKCQIAVLEKFSDFLRAHGHEDAAVRVLLAGSRAAVGLPVS